MREYTQQKVRTGLDEDPLHRYVRGLLAYIQKVRTSFDKDPLYKSTVRKWVDISWLYSWLSEQNGVFLD